MRFASPSTCFESLEPRLTFSGLTIITHGLQSSGVLPQWVDRMAEAVDKRIEPAATASWTDAAFYRMRATGSSPVTISDFSHVAGPSPATSSTGEAVIALDWASVSGLSGPSTALIAAAVVNALSNAGPSLGFSNNALTLPVHLIGHSRGGSLVGEVARLLGQQGVWVDQLTTLDAFPIGSDPSVNISDNVYYADNFYETSDLFVHGSPINGANNVGPLNLPGGAGLAHSDVHTFYHGSIDRAATGDMDVTLNPAWYGNTLGRATAGFDASRVSGGARAAAGLSSLGAGSATRTHVITVDPVPRPNLSLLSITGGTNGAFSVGDAFTLNYRYQTHTSSSEIDVYLDTDQNLFNGFSRVFAIDAALPQTGATPNTLARAVGGTWSSAALSPGVYYINGIITDGSAGHQRVASLAQPVLVTADGMQLITKRWADDTANHDWAEPRNWSPGAAPGATDRALVHFGQSNLATDAGVRALTVASSASLTAFATQHIGAVNVMDNAHAALATNGGRILVAKQLTIESGGDAEFDLADNDLLIDYDGLASPLLSVEGWIRTASNAGVWDGPGLTSSAARTAPLAITTLGALRGDEYRALGNTSFDNEPVDDSSVLVKYTYFGDVDFNGQVDGSDYNNIDFGFLTGRSGWANGDVDFNGQVDGSDYNSIDFAFLTQGGVVL